MSDEEPDYMSDTFLAQCLPQDVKPGLKRTYADKRSHELMKKKEEDREKAVAKEPKKTKQELEEENRQEGLKKTIDASNKGFAMLQKMGYKAGDSLGKSNQGLKEPITIVVKSDRGGLGRAEALRQIEIAKTEFRRKRVEERQRRVQDSTPSVEEFRAQKSKQRRLKQVQSDLYQSQKACRQLDMAKNFNEPAETWFWPEREIKATFEDDEDAADDDKNVVKRNADYDGDDSDDENEEESEYEADDIADQPETLDPVFEEDRPVESDFDSEEMLSIITGYLRSEHIYCVWCGIAFSDLDDLNTNCPGNSRDDHDD